MRGLIIIWGCIAVACACEGRTITVDDDGLADFNNIQAAINDSNEGDTVIVGEGRYYENINFGGKDIVLRSTDPTNSSVVEKTVIDGRYLDSVVMFAGTESPACVLAGFTITRGLAHAVSYNEGRGGGIYGNGTLATIEHNVISNNFSASESPIGLGRGGGLDDCDGPIRYNVIRNNKARGDMAEGFGGGLYGCDGLIQYNVVAANYSDGTGGGMSNCHGTIEQNIIVENGAHSSGGGCSLCNACIKNNTIYDNTSRYGGGGLHWCEGVITGCIVRQNTPTQLASSSTPTYSSIQDWTGGGVGNINSDPCFADPNNGDYHLKSQAGRWDANEGGWAIDDVTSPCIDAGDPMSAIGLEPFPNGGIVNMGAYGGTAEASKSYFGVPTCEVVVPGDVNGDCKVDFLDFSIMALHWLWHE